MSPKIPQLILASASPRRKALLAQIGRDCRPHPVDVSEALIGLAPEWEAVRLALLKVHAAARALWTKKTRFKYCFLGADTLVWLGNKALEKPRNAREAEAMLRSLSGRCHRVITGVALFYRGQALTAVETTKVYFRELSDKEIRAYVRSKEPMDKAGAYGIQGRAAGFVRRIEGDYFNVVGLPLARVEEMLQALEMKVELIRRDNRNIF